MKLGYYVCLNVWLCNMGYQFTVNPYFVRPQNGLFNIIKQSLWFLKTNSWFCDIKPYFLYHKIDFYITKSISLYKNSSWVCESQNRFCDVKKSNCDITKSRSIIDFVITQNMKSKKISNDQVPNPALKTKKEITKCINWQQFTKGTHGKPNEQLGHSTKKLRPHPTKINSFMSGPSLRLTPDPPPCN